MKLTAGQAAKETGKSIPTITRAIASGRLSAEKSEDGRGYLIDPAELFRVFQPVTQGVTKDPANPAMLGDEIPNETGVLEVELAVLREKLRLIETFGADRIAQLETQIADMRRAVEVADRRADQWREQAERITRLLPPPETPALAPAEAAQRVSWLGRLLGRGKV